MSLPKNRPNSARKAPSRRPRNPASPPKPAESAPAALKKPSAYREQYGVIVLCDDEAHHRQVYEQLLAQGHRCKVVAT